MTIRYCLNVIIFSNYHFINFYVVKFPLDNIKFLLNFLAILLAYFVTQHLAKWGNFNLSINRLSTLLLLHFKTINFLPGRFISYFKKAIVLETGRRIRSTHPKVFYEKTVFENFGILEK